MCRKGTMGKPRGRNKGGPSHVELCAATDQEDSLSFHHFYSFLNYTHFARSLLAGAARDGCTGRPHAGHDGPQCSLPCADLNGRSNPPKLLSPHRHAAREKLFGDSVTCTDGAPSMQPTDCGPWRSSARSRTVKIALQQQMVLILCATSSIL